MTAMNNWGVVSFGIALMSLIGTWVQVWQGRRRSISKAAKEGDTQVGLTRKRFISIAVTATLVFTSSLLGAYFSKPRYEKIADDKLTPIIGKQFVNEIVDVDGKHFENCQFISVTLHLSGKHNFAMVRDDFQGPLRITFDSEVNSQSSSVVVAMLQQSGMIANGRVGFIQPNDSVVILRDAKQ